MRSGLFLFYALTTTLAYPQAKPVSAPFGCPDTITVTESAPPAEGWEAGGGKVERWFERASVYNGKPGGREYELAPENQKQQGKKITQVWHLKPYRTMNIFLRCRYRDTPVVLSRDIPANLGACTLTFDTDTKGRILGKSRFVCR